MGLMPLSEPVLMVLLSLAERPRHGYAILKDVEQMSLGRVVLSTGTLCMGSTLISGAVGYGVMVVLRRTGVDRFANMQTWPNRR